MSDYVMPEARLGDVVLFRPHEGADAQMAFVTKVGRETVELWALSPGYGGVEKPSVHHISDPRLQTSSEWKVYGTWEHKPRESMLAQLSERLAILEKAVQGNKK